MRVGLGYDIHRLEEGRKLVLGGVVIPFAKGLLGHSDADVLTHAICDAILGAAGLEDIGHHFPDTDPQFKDISSLKLLAWTSDKIQKQHLAIGNIDAVVFAEQPRIAPYREAMVHNIANTLGINNQRINVKATTAEKLGIIGQGEAIAAMAIAGLENRI